MKAIIRDRFGPPEALRLADVNPPAIGPGDVLVQVHAAGLNPYDWHMLRGDPADRPADPQRHGADRGRSTAWRGSRSRHRGAGWHGRARAFSR